MLFSEQNPRQSRTPTNLLKAANDMNSRINEHTPPRITLDIPRSELFVRSRDNAREPRAFH